MLIQMMFKMPHLGHVSCICILRVQT
jgi:hypothetical protein